MALYDWNNDGKNVASDDFVEYNIYKDCTDEDKTDSSNNIKSSENESGCAFLLWFSVIMIIIGFIINLD